MNITNSHFTTHKILDCSDFEAYPYPLLPGRATVQNPAGTRKRAYAEKSKTQIFFDTLPLK